MPSKEKKSFVNISLLVLLTPVLIASTLLLSCPAAAADSEISFRFVTKYPALEKPPLAVMPRHLDFDDEGNLYIADQPGHRIVSLKPDGSSRLAWGSNGAGEGKFSYPYSVAVSSDNRVYVSDRNDKIQVFNTRGRFLFEIEKEFDFGMGGGGLSVGADQLLYVADTANHKIQVFSLDSLDGTATFIESIEEGLNEPESVASISSDKIAVSDFSEDTVQLLVRSGSETGWVMEREWYVRNPFQVAFDPDRNLLAVAVGFDDDEDFAGIRFF